MSTIITFIQRSIGTPSHSNQAWKRNRRNPSEKEEVKLSLFADDIILNTENPKDVTKHLLEFINEFRKVAGQCRINIQNMQRTHATQHQ